MASSILLQGGTVLVHDENEHVRPIKADILIEGRLFPRSKLALQLARGSRSLIVQNKILSPGFVDTHHHVWQTLLKGRHANDLLLDYFGHGNFTNPLHTPEDIFWDQLAGCLESLDAGTTTFVDHAHLNKSPDSTKAAIAATISSGIRSAPFADGRVSLGFAFDDFYLPKEVLAGIYEHVKSLGINVSTMHYVRNVITGEDVSEELVKRRELI
ncbi:hypothetical protein BKA65DRAFT_556389 [Rhexocercosporidium sp. MPI-PUGE-AT-0058]|nr:hypothetical protein BKA65DRAFT_556389 [Rhexocercosporidium sp. MPI-PUGE-AT-0058]